MKNISLILLVLFCLSCNSNSSGTEHETEFAVRKTAAFSAVKFDKDKIMVEVESAWYQLMKMDTIDADFLLEQSKAVYGDDYQKRLSEDFVEFAHKIDVKPLQKERFTLIDSKGEIFEKELTFTSANRVSSKDYYETNYVGADVDFTQTISTEMMLTDIDYLDGLLRNNYSYTHMNGVDVEGELERLRKSAKQPHTLLSFGLDLQRLIYQFGDGHSRVRKLDLKSKGILPFKTHILGDRIVCHDGQEPVMEGYPFLHSINGVGVKDLMSTAKTHLVAAASPQFVNRVAAENIYLIGFLLDKHNALSQDLDIVFSNKKGTTKSKQFKLDFTKKSKVTYAEMLKKMKNPETFEDKMLRDNIGYLQIKSMDRKGVEEKIAGYMQQFKETNGLVIDVRNNGGGSRKILTELMPYFIKADQSPVLCNLAVYRTDERELPPEGFLDDRYLYPITSSQFTDNDKKTIQEFMTSFKPSFDFDTINYSDWHYLLIHADDKKTFYDKPVVILMNPFCYSATDIFLAAFNQLDNVTLMGTKSGGGSGRTRKYVLPESKLSLKLSSIISFQPEGLLYDGVGVSPDIELEQATVDDVLGKTDNQLDAAISLILGK